MDRADTLRLILGSRDKATGELLPMHHMTPAEKRPPTAKSRAAAIAAQSPAVPKVVRPKKARS